MNDTQDFYDISGVDVPADRIAFVLQKVASGETTKQASLEAITSYGVRKPMLLTKAAGLLTKLSKIEKEVQGIVEGDKAPDLDAFKDSDEAKKDFIIAISNYPSDEVVDGCNRKGILLSPEMLFKILGKDCENGDVLCTCDDDSCGDMSCMMQELEDDEDNRNNILLDGSFDQAMPADLNLDQILESFIPEFGVTNPALQAKSIHIIITNKPRKNENKQKKEASFNKYAQEALRRTYARYLISFAAQNDDATCENALMKIAAYGK